MAFSGDIFPFRITTFYQLNKALVFVKIKPRISEVTKSFVINIPSKRTGQYCK